VKEGITFGHKHQKRNGRVTTRRKANNRGVLNLVYDEAKKGRKKGKGIQKFWRETSRGGGAGRIGKIACNSSVVCLAKNLKY